MGFFNDMVGDKTDTAEWLGWLKDGGAQETLGRSIELKELTSWGKMQPIGGEFTSGIPMDTLLGKDIGQVLEDVSASNMTFIGPMVPDLTDEKYELAAQSVLRRMGYRIYVSRLKTQYDFANQAMNIELTFRNAGSSGFYFDWPVTVYLFDGNKNQVFWEGLPVDLRELNTQDEITVATQVPFSEENRDAFYIGVAIRDYNGKNSVRLAIDTENEPEFADDVQLIYHYQKPGME